MIGGGGGGGGEGEERLHQHQQGWKSLEYAMYNILDAGGKGESWWITGHGQEAGGRASRGEACWLQEVSNSTFPSASAPIGLKIHLGENACHLQGIDRRLVVEQVAPAMQQLVHDRVPAVRELLYTSVAAWLGHGR